MQSITDLKIHLRILLYLTGVWHIVALCPIACTQEFSKLEVSAQATGVTLVDPIDSTATQGGAGITTVWNLSSLLSLESEADYLYTGHHTDFQRGGRAFVLLAGPKASWRRRRFTLFATARPGFVAFERAEQISLKIFPNGVEGFRVHAGHRNHLALDLGAGIEIDTGTRSYIRLDLSQTLLRYGDQVHHLPASSFTLEIPGTIGSANRLSVGFGYRLGSLREPSTSEPVPQKVRRWEIGGHYGVLSLARASVSGPLVMSYQPFSLGDDPGGGATVTYNLKHWLSLESAATYFYKEGTVQDPQRNGRMLEGVFGPKFGARREKIGLFAKARPGFLSYGAVHDNYFPPYPAHRLTHLALDFGGVLEYYPSPKTVLRFDLGALGVRYGPVRVLAPQNSLYPTGGFVEKGFHDLGIQFMTGFAWRF